MDPLFSLSAAFTYKSANDQRNHTEQSTISFVEEIDTESVPTSVEFSNSSSYVATGAARYGPGVSISRNTVNTGVITSLISTGPMSVTRNSDAILNSDLEVPRITETLLPVGKAECVSMRDGTERVSMRDGTERVSMRDGTERVSMRDGTERVSMRDGTSFGVIPKHAFVPATSSQGKSAQPAPPQSPAAVLQVFESTRLTA